MNSTKQAYEEAKKVVHGCIHSLGIKASALESGYPQIWARDCMITLLGAILLDNKDITTGIKNSLQTLQDAQTEVGCIPSNVDTKTKQADFRSYIDGNSWYIIGHNLYYKKEHDKAFLKKSWVSIKRTLHWLQSQDVYQNDLVVMQEGADWMDLLAVRGAGLYINALYYQALQSASELAKVLGDTTSQETYFQKARKVRNKMRQLFWVDFNKTKTEEPFVNDEIHILRGQKMAVLQDRPYFLPYIGFRTAGDWFDTLGNMLTIIFGIADEKKTANILDFAKQVGISSPYPAKALYPAIHQGHSDWREYYLNKNLNLPHQYHNGGIWPFIGGFTVVALVKANRLEEAEQALIRLVASNKKGRMREWEFNEWLHGITCEPMGRELQAWSAGMYIFAYESLKQKSTIHFN